MRSSLAMFLAIVLGLIDTSAAQCTNLCGGLHYGYKASDGNCDDGGPGAQTSDCSLGTDCSDCGPRIAPPAPPDSFGYRCTESCGWSWDNYCDDGGPGSAYSKCDRGTDCTDCGTRLIMRAPFAASAAGWPNIVVSGSNGNHPEPSMSWTLICTNNFSIPNGAVPQTVQNPSFQPGSTCTLTLRSQYNILGASWIFGTASNPILYYTFDGAGFQTTYSFTVPGPPQEPSPSPSPEPVVVPPFPPFPPPPTSLPPPPPPPAPAPAPATCTNLCGNLHYGYRASNGNCDDGGPGAQTSDCSLGTDCIDCGPRVLPPAPPDSFGYRCFESCGWSWDNYCDDGGPGSAYSKCDRGTDCRDCGPRLMTRAPFVASAAGWPNIVVGSNGNYPEPTLSWTLTCTGGFSIPNGAVPQTVQNPSFQPGSTCTLTLKSQWGWSWASR
ncbi:ankyrin neuronal-like protein, partial [Chrysochromulina tobinii]